MDIDRGPDSFHHDSPPVRFVFSHYFSGICRSGAGCADMGTTAINRNMHIRVWSVLFKTKIIKEDQ